ncbi:MAG: hypothetical protein GY774_04800 [Planctomycetes bacterium]|nr:hypothetical protein [Planctomycetota bacterium]
MKLNRALGIRSIRFESLNDLLNTQPTLEANRRLMRILKANSLVGQIGADSWDAVINKAVNGDAYLLKELQERRRALSGLSKKEPLHSIVTLPKRRRRRCKGSQGDHLDIHRVYQGQLDKAWETRKKVELQSRSKLYTVLIDVGGLSRVEFSSSLWRGAVAFQITDELIKAGKSVKIVVGAAAVNVVDNGDIVTTDIVVKEHNEPLSMERLAAMSNIGFHRVFNFKARCYLDSRCANNMGHTANYLETNGPVDPTGTPQDVSHYVYVGRSVTQQQAVCNLKTIYSGLKLNEIK